MKQLIIAACLVNYHDDRGAQHQDVGDIVDVTKDTAEKLANTDRALYVVKADDPTKEKRYTATREMIKAAEDMAKEKAAAAKESANPPA